MTAAVLEALDANEAFYRAFSARDVEAMSRIWAERHAVTCVHPGWDLLEGRDRVLASWRAILGSGNAPEVVCERAEAHLVGDVILVTCHEVIASGRLAVTNAFAREDGAWRMVHHQATPIAPGQVRPLPRSGPSN
jgi:ketosteroid isomerase-like protein